GEGGGWGGGRLRGGDVLEWRRTVEPVAEPQVADVLLLAVGGDDRGVAGRVELADRSRGEVARRPPRETRHRPRIQHGGRRHDAPLDRLCGGPPLRVGRGGLPHPTPPGAGPPAAARGSPPP